MGELNTLTESECRALLRDADSGRMAVNTPDGPHIIPVNYAVVDETLVFRTDPSTLIGTYAPVSRVAFEVDFTDDVRQIGWSVQARGWVSEVHDPEEIAHIRRVWEPVPWAAGERNLFLRLVYDVLSGRSVGMLEKPPTVPF